MEHGHTAEQEPGEGGRRGEGERRRRVAGAGKGCGEGGRGGEMGVEDRRGRRGRSRAVRWWKRGCWAQGGEERGLEGEEGAHEVRVERRGDQEEMGGWSECRWRGGGHRGTTLSSSHWTWTVCVLLLLGVCPSPRWCRAALPPLSCAALLSPPALSGHHQGQQCPQHSGPAAGGA